MEVEVEGSEVEVEVEGALEDEKTARFAKVWEV